MLIRNKIRFASGLLLLVCFITTMVGCRGMFFTSERYYRKSLEHAPYDAVIVPGVPFENGQWSYTMKGRVLWSIYLYRAGIARNLIFSGSAVYSPFVEGKIMALYAEQLGVPEENIFVEDRAEHSTENVYYGTVLARKYGFKKVAVATDRFQSRTLVTFVNKLHAGIRLLPMQDSLLQKMPHTDPVIDSMQAYNQTFVSIVERESFFKRFRGTMGKNIEIKKDSLKIE
jgi:vancomycin permeability regulator SanA